MNIEQTSAAMKAVDDFLRSRGAYIGAVSTLELVELMVVALATQPPQDERGQGLTPEEQGYVPLSADGKSVFMDGFGIVPLAYPPVEPEQPVALSTLTDSEIVKQVKNSFDSYDHAEINRRELVQSIRAALAASAPAQQAGRGWKLVPAQPTTAMVSAMACSQARDDEGQFPSLLDLIDYSGENKTNTVLKAAYQAMLDASPAHESATPPQPVALEDIETYRMQMAGIMTASLGYWKEGDAIHPDYDTVALRDVAKLYAKYDALFQARDAAKSTPPQPVAAEVTDTRRLDWLLHKLSGAELRRIGIEKVSGGAYWVREAIDSAMAGTGSDESGENSNG